MKIALIIIYIVSALMIGFFFAAIWVNGNTTLSEKFFYSGGLCSVMFIVCAFIFEAIVKINEEDEEDKEDEE